ncbi:MAG: tRNA pseudouridine(55) synthase TruB [Anaerovoracaceae bacterium]|nr:tRNA pseudouridine(55) synthase TruB [Bacillota bacterium]MDY3954920.1 tRNA pseudouridine(55) synthase TruB [Anaerovoracaceae bacterium]
MTEREGIINLLKPAGMTSHDAVYFLRRLTGEKRIGHTGTLDPMAVGVLPLCIGNATRIIEYLDADRKSYRCEMLLGIETDTQDIWGEVLCDRRKSAGNLTAEKLKEVLETFQGDIFQIPPRYSSVRINGRHLYEYARKGEEVEIKPRPVQIYNLNLISFHSDTGRAVFDVTCSKGTYIRSICQAAGEILGCGAAMSFLARTGSGVFRIEDAVTMEELQEGWEKNLISPDSPLMHFGKLEIPEHRKNWYLNGGYLRTGEVKVTKRPEPVYAAEHISIKKEMGKAYCVYCMEEFLGVSIYHEEKRQYLVDKVLGKRR